MLSLAIVLITALLLGMRHATDADHVLAVSTIVTRERSLWRAGGVGVLWGAGHSVTILAVGGLLVAANAVVPARLGLGFEACVALMLMLLGARSLLSHRGHSHALPRVPPFAVGVVHGLAGSATAALLIVPLIRDPLSATLYLLVFGLGTIAGMTLLTCAIAGSTMVVMYRVRGLERWLGVCAGAASFALGAVMLVDIARAI